MEQEKQKKQWIAPEIEVISSYSIEGGSVPGPSEGAVGPKSSKTGNGLS
ncbi:hypothetical protein [Mucilaginibacter jinjuensis]|uniref:Paeninodin family lasso peptide n=1 Tax=Mucilaginibacter jinjuensis TaxID=1176721 RepID=A0ABY7T8D9_9SPHI|nr:hypothetical protein [Mucilaginibacter jinjuensis]WCT11937.1 hypothetical protein PQO05_24705 [Mucilaginibacter jinjuensis]